MADIASTEPESQQDVDDSTAARGRIRTVFSGSRDLMRLAWRDPENIPERLTLYAASRLGDQTKEWAATVRREEPDLDRAVISEELRTRTARIARVDGAISGTPFFLALVPGYLSYLWQEARMTLRIAALYGHDPSSLDTACEMLALRGVHETAEDARAALTAIPPGLPPRPTHRRTLGTWVRAVWMVLVFGGFVSASTAEDRARKHRRLRTAVSVTIGTVLWAVTWIVPITFMIAMAWGCETHARELGRQTLLFYAGDADTALEAIAKAKERREDGRTRRDVIRGALLGLSVLVPIAFVAYAQHIKNTTGVNGITALGSLVAISLVLAFAVV